MRRPVITLLTVLLLYVGGIAASFVICADWTARQTVAVVLTGAVVIWYTWETMLLRHVAMLQREQSLRPFVLFKGDAYKYLVENLGPTPALGVAIQPVTLRDEGIDLVIDFPQPVPLLRPGETAPIAAKVTLNGKDIGSINAAHLDPKYAIAEIDVHITFRSIEGKSYGLIQTTAPNATVVKGFREAAA